MTTSPTTVATKPPRRSRWGWWVLGILGVLVLLLGLALLLLDPWLKRQLEKQVSQKTQGQYQLRIGELRTRLLARSIRLQQVELIPQASVADTLPRIRLLLPELRVSGVGLLALLRKGVVPIDSVVLDSVRLQVLALAQKPGAHAGQPLHARLPLGIKGLRLGFLGLRHAQAQYGPAQQPVAAVRQAELQGRDLLLSAAGAADTQRLAYAAGWQLQLLGSQGQAAGHRLRLHRLDFATARQVLVLDSLRILPPDKMQPGAVRVDLKLPHFALTGLRAAALQHQRRLRADSLLLQSPRLTFKPPAKAPPPIWKLLQPLARRIDLAHLRLRNGWVHVLRTKHAPIIRDLNVVGTGLRVDSAAAHSPQRIAYARAWQAEAGRLVTTFDAPCYKASSQHLRLNTATRTLRFDDLRLKPAFSPVGMNLHKGYQVPAISIRLPSLTASGFDFMALAQQGRFRVERVVVQSPSVRIASDGRGPINPHQSKVTPDAIRQVATPLDIRRLDIRNGNLYSSYRSPLTPRTGRLSINRFTGTLRNLSNSKRRQTQPLTAHAVAYLQNQCRIEAWAVVPLLDPNGRHRVWGTFGPAPFAILNPMTVPTRLVRFKKGQVQRIRFELQADKKQVSGSMRAEYSGLQLQLLGYKNGEIKKPLLKRVISKAANVVLIRDQNPRKRGKLVVGEMTSRREPRFSVFTLWRQGLVSGLFHSVGLPQKMAQKISEQKDEAPLPK